MDEERKSRCLVDELFFQKPFCWLLISVRNNESKLQMSSKQKQSLGIVSIKKNGRS